MDRELRTARFSPEAVFDAKPNDFYTAALHILQPLCTFCSRFAHFVGDFADFVGDFADCFDDFAHFVGGLHVLSAILKVFLSTLHVLLPTLFILKALCRPNTFCGKTSDHS